MSLDELIPPTPSIIMSEMMMRRKTTWRPVETIKLQTDLKYDPQKWRLSVFIKQAECPFNVRRNMQWQVSLQEMVQDRVQEHIHSHIRSTVQNRGRSEACVVSDGPLVSFVWPIQEDGLQPVDCRGGG